MRLSFHGADRDVTGSCHLLEAAEKKILIDCGLLQGSRELNEENAGAFGFDAESVSVLGPLVCSVLPPPSFFGSGDFSSSLSGANGDGRSLSITIR